ncbi:MAG: tol-pal system protein YbgF [Alphaproteobacteria bacterium]|nr:tol-pal system protein YbgF [Alphaproteobacteria bacterium]MBU1516216.1 tol-pal system protein YbgF [Alphaproteobacteria bacterium]MBU2095753.1 tol-pal system protein YbgF [Alphaproteobacteria bacterium]MBU2152070.1 tol-pal system protein YbgF [Alphaproteobacteria bacterium]MBU2306660.1 tol-pal system protein YbgF [Alphaproteobacteria bacterium]
MLLALAVLGTAGPAMSQTPLPPVDQPDPLDARDAKRVERMEKVVRELRAIVFQLRDSGKPVVVQPADTDARMAEMADKLNDLESTLRGLNGSLEGVTRDADLAKRENTALKTQIQTLNDRLAALEGKVAAVQAPPPADTLGGAAPTAPAGDPAKDFTQARQLMLAGDYDAAENAFANYVEIYPDAPRTAEARYWLGKTLSVRGAHANAAQAYIGAIRGWPQTTWAPDAVVELARSLVALKKPTDACQTLAEFTRRYPKAPAPIASRAAATRTQAKCAA